MEHLTSTDRQKSESMVLQYGTFNIDRQTQNTTVRNTDSMVLQYGTFNIGRKTDIKVTTIHTDSMVLQYGTFNIDRQTQRRQSDILTAWSCNTEHLTLAERQT